ncbi:MAG: hypothetical protein R3322_00310 [Kiloniellales bacterium]|nr:hypothetical protein [Kiloniellales bacterium]
MAIVQRIYRRAGVSNQRLQIEVSPTASGVSTFTEGVVLQIDDAVSGAVDTLDQFMESVGFVLDLSNPQVDLDTHGSRHAPSGSDPLSLGAPIAISDTTNSAGSANSFPRSDHVHAHGSRGGGTLHTAATAGVSGFMSAADKSKLDGIPASATSNAAASQNSTSSSGTTSATFAAAFGSALNPSEDGDYLAIFETDTDNTTNNTVGEIALGLNSTTTAVAGTARQTQGSSRRNSTTTHLFSGLTTGDGIRAIFRRASGTGTVNIYNRRITLIKAN